MWHTQKENTLLACATTADNVLSLMSLKRTGVDSKSVKPTMNQKNHNSNHLDIVVMQLHYLSLAQIVLSQWTYSWVLPGIALFKALVAPTARLGQVLVSITNPPEEVLDGVSATAAVGQVEVDANSLIFTPTGIASSTDIGQVDTFTTQFVTVTAGSVVGQGQAGQAQGEGNSIFVFPESQEISGQVSPVIVVQDEDALPSGVEGVGESGAVSAVPGVEAQVIGVSSTVSDGDADIIGDASVISTGVAGAGTTGSVG
jgi:hypothetical protein